MHWSEANLLRLCGRSRAWYWYRMPLPSSRFLCCVAKIALSNQVTQPSVANMEAECASQTQHRPRVAGDLALWKLLGQEKNAVANAAPAGRRYHVLTEPPDMLCDAGLHLTQEMRGFLCCCWFGCGRWYSGWAGVSPKGGWRPHHFCCELWWVGQTGRKPAPAWEGEGY
jgi:hypothetical protein